MVCKGGWGGMRALVCAGNACPHAVTTLGRRWCRGCAAGTLDPDTRGAPGAPHANHAVEDRVSSPRLPNHKRAGSEDAEACKIFHLHKYEPKQYQRFL